MTIVLLALILPPLASYETLNCIGLNGIEVLNISKTSTYEFDLYRNIASKLDLLESCGSDFHGKSTPNIGIENEISKKLIYKIKER